MSLDKAAYTTIINTSGGRKYYSFLPPHGLTLEDGQSLTFTGEIADRLVPGWPYNTDKRRPPNATKLKGLQDAEDRGELIIIRSPLPRRHKLLTEQFRRIDKLGMSILSATN